ncbi:MAG: hypothetical protein OXT67_11865 [Zetaproteobacteria bacterium]|nr:hypothetical protein [Zetaproteobacteria bacterium]
MPYKFQAILVTCAALTCACKPQSSPSKSTSIQPSSSAARSQVSSESSKQNGTADHTTVVASVDSRIARIAAQYVPLSKIDQFALDTKDFRVDRLEVGLEDYIENDTPYLAYKRPHHGDYVQIIRCESSTTLEGREGRELSSLENNVMSDAELESIMHANDYWNFALEKKTCTIISNGTTQDRYLDTFAPSGNFYYLMRVCVADSRLDKASNGTLSSRTCSQFVTISKHIQGFRSLRSDEVRRLYKAAEAARATLEGTIRALQALTEKAVAALDRCAEREHQRLVDTALRKSWLYIAAASLELGLEIASAVQGFEPGKIASFQTLIDAGGIISSAEGTQFKQMFENIFASSQEMQRQCYEYEGYAHQLALIESKLDISYGQAMFYHGSAALIEQQADQLAAIPVEIPPNRSLQELETYLQESGFLSTEEPTTQAATTDNAKTEQEGSK